MGAGREQVEALSEAMAALRKAVEAGIRLDDDMLAKSREVPPPHVYPSIAMCYLSVCLSVCLCIYISSNMCINVVCTFACILRFRMHDVAEHCAWTHVQLHTHRWRRCGRHR